ncbi:MAG TPA: acyltransferase [Candidatus Paceibacterota bacterium]|nr:acyltransferase [Candidatus Paceibacterota bacterium]
MKRFYCPELDALRFWACASVFSLHASVQFMGKGGFVANLPPGPQRLLAAIIRSGSIGVDLFFCISAFLITTLILREREMRGGDFRLGDFFWRRALRIWPLYFGFILVFMVWQPLEPGIRSVHIVMNLLFLGNFSFMLFGINGTTGHLWTIGMEEQFYFVWALTLKFKPKEIGIGKLCAYGLLFSAAYKAFCVSRGIGLWINSPARLDAIFAGIWFADAIRKRGWAPSGRVRLLLLSAGLIGPPFLFLFMDSFQPWGTRVAWGALTFYPLAALCCLCLFGAVYGQRLVKVPESLSYLGKISYGLYVFHPPVLFAVDALLPDAGTRDLWVRIARAGSFVGLSAFVTLALAMASYRWFELPFLKLKDRFSTVPSGDLPDGSGSTKRTMRPASAAEAQNPAPAEATGL